MIHPEPSADEQRQMIEEVRAFVGRNSDYYLARWAPALLGRRWLCGFNVPAMIFGWFWMPYRKMYGITICVLLVSVVVSHLVDFVCAWRGFPETPVAVNSLTAIALGTIVATLANRLYLWHARRKMNRLRARGLEGADYIQALRRAGGTSIISGFLFFPVAAVAMTLILVWVMGLFRIEVR